MPGMHVPTIHVYEQEQTMPDFLLAWEAETEERKKEWRGNRDRPSERSGRIVRRQDEVWSAGR